MTVTEGAIQAHGFQLASLPRCSVSAKPVPVKVPTNSWDSHPSFQLALTLHPFHLIPSILEIYHRPSLPPCHLTPHRPSQPCVRLHARNRNYTITANSVRDFEPMDIHRTMTFQLWYADVSRK